MSKVIYEKEYHGFESLYDLGRDVYEAFDSRFNEKAKDIPGEFQGTVKVTIEYMESEDE